MKQKWLALRYYQRSKRPAIRAVWRHERAESRGSCDAYSSAEHYDRYAAEVGRSYVFKAF